MKSRRKVTFLMASVITTILLAVSVIIVGFSFGWFTDKKGADVTIKVGAIKNTLTSSDEISPSDFVACNYFDKNLTIKVESDFEVYLRTYAKVSMQTTDGERTDLVTLIDVSKCKKGEDNKYYYTNSTTSPVTINGTLTLSLTFRFYVDSSVSNELFTDSTGKINESLKTTITYYFEYCQKEGFDSWASDLKTTEEQKYTVSFNANGGISEYSSKIFVYNEPFGALPNATKEGYTFAGWYTGNGDLVTESTIFTYTKNMTLYARYTINTYIIKFINYNGDVLKTVSAETGTMPEAPTTNPTKPSTAQYDYTFDGWSPAISKVMGDKVYTAIYNQTLRKYKITFVDEDGSTVLQAEKEYYYGETPVYSGATPTKAEDDNYTYEFNGFGTISQVTGDKTYVARYTATPVPSTAEFSSTWKTDIAWSSVNSGLASAADLTKIAFEKTAPSGYTKSNQSLNGGIEVWYNSSMPTEIAFVFKKIIVAPGNCTSLFEQLSIVTEIKFNNFNTSNSTNMYKMFYHCSKLTSLDVSKFDTSNVTSMSSMFIGCSKLTSLNIGKFDTSKVTTMGSMFSSCSGLTTLDVSNFNTSKVTYMGGMFSDCSGLNTLDVSKFDTSNVTDMSSMFNYCSGLTTLDVSKFDTSKVTYMSSMFSGCSGLTTLDVSKFDTSNVTSMERMFYQCRNLTTLDISKFDTSKVAYMSSMFYGCSGLTTLDVSNFNTSKVTNMREMFASCRSLTILDVSKFDTSNVTSIYGMFNNCSSLTNLDVSNFNTSKVTDMHSMFSGCSGLTTLDVSKFDTSKVTDMGSMFYSCSGLTTLDVSKFDTSNVTSMRSMFYSCSSLTNLDVSNFNTSKVTNMQDMFASCRSLTILDVSNFDTSKVSNMYRMFCLCSELTTLDISNFVINSGTTITDMLTGCSKLAEIKAPKTIDSSLSISLPSEFTVSGTTTTITTLTSAYAGKTLTR